MEQVVTRSLAFFSVVGALVKLATILKGVFSPFVSSSSFATQNFLSINWILQI